MGKGSRKGTKEPEQLLLASDGASVRRKSTGVVLIAGAVLWVLTPISGLLWIALQDRSAAFVETVPVWAPVSQSTELVTRTLDLGLAWQPADDLVAPSWAGTVQAVYVSPGSVVSSGTRVAKIDGVLRLAWYSANTFYRPITRGDQGEDVTSLKAMLSERGYTQTSSDVFDYAALSGVRAFAASLGVEDSWRLQGFDPAWIVYLPRKSLVVESVDFHVASPAPAAGSVIAQSTAVLAGAALLEEGTLSGSNNEEDQSLTSFDLDQLVAQYGIQADVGQVLRFDGEPLSLNDSRQRLDESALADLAERLMPGTKSLIVQLGQTPKDSWWVVPAGALSLQDEPTVCLKRGESRKLLKVAVVAASSAGTIVEGAFEVGDRVRVPSATSVDPCP